MFVQDNVSLKPYNSFGLDVTARYFSSFSTEDELEELFDVVKVEGHLILGGGSNILLTKDYNGLVLKNEIAGIEIIKEDEHHVYIKAGAGENWHRFVMFCIERNLAGVENLSLIPGNIGASPMQNIGAYGVELKDVFHELEAYHIRDKKSIIFSANDCQFGYRDSVFKNRLKNQFVITQVIFRLNKVPHFETSYGAIEQELEKMNAEPSVRTISQAVINIRRSKLPDPAEIGNAGSFFKNPIVSLNWYNEIKKLNTNAPGYPQENGSIKLAAGWLIEQCGWKGYRKGDAGVHDKQALVLVNYGSAHGSQILELSEQIKKSVNEKFGVDLETEVNII